MKTTTLPRRVRFLVPSLFAVLTVAAAAQAALSSAGPGELKFRATGPGGLEIDGQGSGVTATEQGGVVKVVAPLGDLKTGQGFGLRDDHLKKALNVAKFPEATLTVERSKLDFPADKQKKESSAVGQLTLHGVTKPAKFKYSVERTGSDYHVVGKLDINLSEFKIEEQCFLRACVRDNVQVITKFKVRED